MNKVSNSCSLVSRVATHSCVNSMITPWNGLLKRNVFTNNRKSLITLTHKKNNTPFTDNHNLNSINNHNNALSPYRSSCMYFSCSKSYSSSAPSSFPSFPEAGDSSSNSMPGAIIGKGHNRYKFDESLVEILVCPVSKAPLRYCKETESLICDEINVSYPIVDGIPRLVPWDGKVLPSK
eukprot:Nk52_evm1s482 gene=Nk52_evmTU1s482